jgi:hypothetical protein
MRDIEDLGSAFLVKVQDTNNYKSRSFAILRKFYLEICRKYIGKFSTIICRPKNVSRHCLSIKKNICNPYFIVIHHDYRLDYERYFLDSKFQNLKLFCHFYHDCSNFVHSCRIFGISELQQFTLIVKMTRIESGVTIPKGLFTT